MTTPTKNAARPIKEVLAHIQWNNVRSWKDPNYVPPNFPAAFSLIRQILTEQPRSFQDMVEAGLRIHAENMKRTAPSTAESSSAAAAWNNFARMSAKMKKKREEDGTGLIPSDHPFQSSKFLRKKIIPVLESLELVHRKAIRPVTGTVRSSRLLESERGHGSPFQFFLSPPPQVSRGSPLRRRNLGQDWDRICTGTFAGVIHGELNALKKESEEQRLERRLKLKLDKRTEEQIWSWSGRQPELTTRKQRFHLNRRKQKNRDKLERRRLQARLRWDKPREEAARRLEAEEKAAKTAQKAAERWARRKGLKAEAREPATQENAAGRAPAEAHVAETVAA